MQSTSNIHVYAYVICVCLIELIIDQVYYPCHCALSRRTENKVAQYTTGSFWLVFVFIKVYDTGTCFLVKKKIFSSISVHGQPL